MALRGHSAAGTGLDDSSRRQTNRYTEGLIGRVDRRTIQTSRRTDRKKSPLGRQAERQAERQKAEKAYKNMHR